MADKVVDDRHPIVLVIHGGAGTILRKNMTAERESHYREALSHALQIGFQVLSTGGSSMDAVEAAVRFMEDSPLFNAGRGSVLNADGSIEMDASVMDGSNLKAGAVCAVTNIKNPVTLARHVMEHTNHVMLSGEGAERFALQSHGVEIVHDVSYFHTEFRQKQLDKLRATDSSAQQLDHNVTVSGSSVMTREEEEEEEAIEEKEHKYGTVGAVALDCNGNLAAATSTGGMTNKMPGRVGDSSIIGAGTYANNETCAVSATGHGEVFIRACVSHDISAMMEYKGVPLVEAAEDVVMRKLVNMGGSGGVVAVDGRGSIAMPFNSEGMYRGFARGYFSSKAMGDAVSSCEKMVAIFRDDECE